MDSTGLNTFHIISPLPIVLAFNLLCVYICLLLVWASICALLALSISSWICTSISNCTKASWVVYFHQLLFLLLLLDLYSYLGCSVICTSSCYIIIFFTCSNSCSADLCSINCSVFVNLFFFIKSRMLICFAILPLLPIGFFWSLLNCTWGNKVFYCVAYFASNTFYCIPNAFV